MVCPFKQNVKKEIMYKPWGEKIVDKEITTVTFGECEGCDCPFFNLVYDRCTFKGVIQK